MLETARVLKCPGMWCVFVCKGGGVEEKVGEDGRERERKQQRKRENEREGGRERE